jgi:hypothetical protein
MSFVSTVFDAESKKTVPKKAAPKPALKKIVEAVKEVLAPDEVPAKEEE